jgi:hypothetical protein
MPSTANLGLPYPDLTNAPNVPADIGALAARLEALLGTAQTPWTPVWQQSSGATLAISDGTLVGSYRQVGKFVTAKLLLTRGPSTNLGTLSYQWVLPVPAKDTISTGTGLVRQVTPTTDIFCVARLISSTVLALGRSDNFARIGATNPGAWAVGDTIQWSITYEAA